MRVNVGTKNPAKVDGVKKAFSHYFDAIEVVPVSVVSEVSIQPKTLSEIVAGAKTRAVASFGNCDFSVGVEGGIIPFPEAKSGYVNLGVAVIYDGKNNYIGASPCFEYPAKAVQEALKGEEIGTVFDRLTNSENTKQKDGAVGFLTKGVMTRGDLVETTVVMALCRIVNKEFYEKND